MESPKARKGPRRVHTLRRRAHLSTESLAKPEASSKCPLNRLEKSGFRWK